MYLSIICSARISCQSCQSCQSEIREFNREIVSSFSTTNLLKHQTESSHNISPLCTRIMLQSHLRLLSPTLTQFGRLVDSNSIDLSTSSLLANPLLAQEIVSSLYKFGLLVFRKQTHLKPSDEIHLAKLFSHHPSIDCEDENQSYTGGAGTQHRLPQYPQIALVGSYSVKDFYGLTAESKGVYNGWPLGQRAWHCDGLAE